MTAITLHQFDTAALLNDSVVALLKYHFEQEYPFSHAVMLSGGNTPLAAYAQIAKSQCTAARSLRVLFSDERLVPPGSGASNFGNARSMIESLRLNENQVIRVQPELAPEQAAERYDAELRKFLNCGGRITLGLLGLGTDGHTASLFSEKDMERGRYAVATVAPDGGKRVSVTPELLNKIRQIVFVVSGSGKKSIVEKLANTPSQVTAGSVVAGVKMKQIWFVPVLTQGELMRRR